MTRLSAMLRRRIEIPILAVLATLLVVIASDVPSVWYDESATIASAIRTWPQLWAMLGTVDAVHGLFYAGMHLWFDLVGYSPFTLRFPSAIFSGATVALTMLLASRFGSRGFSVLAGVILITIPRFTWAGMEGRSYALTATLAVALTLLLVRALDATGRAGDAGRTSGEADPRAGAASGTPQGLRRSRWRAALPWIAYGAVGLFAVVIFVYLALVIVAHAVSVLLLTRWGSLTRRQLIAFGATVVPLGIVSIPFVLAVSRQSGQVGWLDPISEGTIPGILVTQFAPSNSPYAVFIWLVVLLGLATLVTTLVRARRASAVRAAVTGDARASIIRTTSLAAWILPWLIVPTVLLVAVSVLVTPLYSPRYLTFLVPALAIAVAAGLVGIGRVATHLAGRAARRPSLRAAPLTLIVCIAGVLVLVLLSVPSYVSQRQPEAKQSSSWSQVAARVATITSSLPAEPDGSAPAVVFGSVAYHPTATARVVQYSYPWAFTGLDDVALVKPLGTTNRLWETAQPVTSELLSGHDSVILVSSGRDRESNQQAIEAAGFHLVDDWHYTRMWVRLFER
ncbi:hypothetical protein [Agreia sp. COWG]|uniref:glycosyltransferase family 39 protein n=1 Tax=Agreia sp. COWG TaxID=2773266 RepID=UPI0019256F80|nr:hypothetical protein [Agreia sp. COWG]CAD5989297.1 conserved membrane protein of unknown function [Agreia sp. COWG]